MTHHRTDALRVAPVADIAESKTNRQGSRPAVRDPERPAPFSAEYGVWAGVLIRQELDARGLSQAELAARTGLSPKHVNQVIQGVAPLSTETALLIERALGISADLLTEIEAGYQAARGRESARAKLSAYRNWLKEFPVEELIRRGVLDQHADTLDQIEQLLAFFGVANPEAFDRFYDDAVMSFRRAQHLTVDVKATAVWLRIAEREAAAVGSLSYNRKMFLSLLDRLPSLTRDPISKVFPTLQAECSAAGVIVVFVPDVKGARACAATRWIGADRPVIALSGRGQYEDGLWFNFFHEAGHILLHPKRRSVVHLEGEGDDGDGAETEANKFAAELLLRHHDPAVLRAVRKHEDVRALAMKLEVDPGILAGRIAHERGPAAWRKYARLRRKIDI